MLDAAVSVCMSILILLSAIYHRLLWSTQSMAVKIVETILTVNTEITEPAQVETLLDFIKPLIADTLGVEVDDEVCLHKCLNAQKQPSAIMCLKTLKLMKNGLPKICLHAVLLLLVIQASNSVQDFEEEQDLVARIIHRMRSSDTAQHFAMLCTAWERLSVGGPRRLRHTIPPIAFAALHIARRKAAAGDGEPSAQEVFSNTPLRCCLC